MSGLFGMLFALAGTLWAVKWLWPVALFAVFIWLMSRWLKSSARKDMIKHRRKRLAEIKEQRRLAEIAARADEQHNLRMQGDPRGIYGCAAPAMRKFAAAVEGRTPNG